MTNIKKITSAMKMVAASKMRKAQASQVQAQGLPIPFLKMFGEETSTISAWNQNQSVTFFVGELFANRVVCRHACAQGGERAFVD